MSKGRLWKRVTASVLSAAVALTCTSLAIPSAADADAPAVWDGTAAVEYAGGDGTQANPYQIATAEQLALLGKTTVENVGDTNGKYYELTADIYLNDVSAPDWQTASPNQWPYGTAGEFLGNLDGNGHIIRGLYVNSELEYVGLFKRLVSPAVVENLGFADSYLKAATAAAALAGEEHNWGDADGTIRISRCFVDSTVLVEGEDTGGLVGRAIFSTVMENCYSAAELAGTGHKGGLIANTWVADMLSLTDCFGAQTNCSLVGNVYTACAYADCYAAGGNANAEGLTNISLDSMKGETAKTVMPGLDFESVWTAVEGCLPKLAVFADFPGTAVDEDDPSEGDEDGGNDGQPGEAWSGGVASGYAAGSGTKDDPYEIATAEQLALLGDTVSKNQATKDVYYELTQDIFLNDVSDPDWQANSPTAWPYGTTGDFCGNLNGNGHIIRGLYISTEQDGAGLFWQLVSPAVVENLGFADSYIKAANFAGALAGKQDSWAAPDGTLQIRGCFVDSTVKVEGQSTGGLMGWAFLPAELENCYSAAELVSTGYKGGLIGNTWAGPDTISLTGCFSAQADCGLVGQQASNCTYTACYAAGGTKSIENLTVIPVESMVGEDAKTAMPDLDYTSVYKTVEGRLPRLVVFEGFEGTVVDTAGPEEDDGDKTPGKVWDGTVAEEYAAGNGTESNPYQITTAEQLALLISTGSGTQGKYYVITDDILINDTSAENWTETAREWVNGSDLADPRFMGTIDGQGHIVSGIYMDAKGTNANAALFPAMGPEAVIKNIGLTNADINSEYAAGGIVAVVYGDPFEVPAYVIGCFGDTSVSIRGSFAGGIIGGTGSAAVIDSCYFIGTTRASGLAGGFIGSKWNTTDNCFATIRNSFCATADNDKPVNNLISYATFENSYATTAVGNCNRVALRNMQGEKALETMAGLDFENTWDIAEGTPVLRQYGDKRYTRLAVKEYVTISFDTNGGGELESITGSPDEPLSLPTPTRGSDIFDGWYVYPELDVPFTLDYFPENSITLYAGWVTTSIVQDFENYPYSVSGEDGLDMDYELYRPSMRDYDEAFVHGGVRSIHRVGEDETAGYQCFSIFADMQGNETVGKVFGNTGAALVPGETYTIKFWVYLENVTDADSVLGIAHTNEYNYNATDYPIQSIVRLGALETGSWQEVSYTFEAKSSYLAICTPGMTSLFIDDIVIVPTNQAVSGDENSPVTGESASSAFIVLGVALVSLVVLFKFRRKKWMAQ